MNNKLFIFLVVVLSLLILASLGGLLYSIVKYNNISYKNSINNKPNVSTSSTNTTTRDDLQPEAFDIQEPKYILPSDSKTITEADLAGMDYDTLNKAYNEIFARHGHDFQSKNLREYFNEQSWYKATPNKSVSVAELSELETKNLSTIRNKINEVKAAN